MAPADRRAEAQILLVRLADRFVKVLQRKTLVIFFLALE
jgi:hypothetical protein